VKPWLVRNLIILDLLVSIPGDHPTSVVTLVYLGITLAILLLEEEDCVELARLDRFPIITGPLLVTVITNNSTPTLLLLAINRLGYKVTSLLLDSVITIRLITILLKE
jgi:hypothetical protein